MLKGPAKIMAKKTDRSTVFDIDEHREAAIRRYRYIKGLYEEFAEVLRHILGEALIAASVKIHSIEARAKSIESFGKKASQPSFSDPGRPRFKDPLAQMTDIAGVRVITFFPKTLDEVDRTIRSEFKVIQKKDKRRQSAGPYRFGYQSIHYLVRLNPRRATLPEYRCFANLTAEVQVRTILQHAWAEMEHDIRYKPVAAIPATLRKRFDALAETIEQADREFQAIQDEDENLRRIAVMSMSAGNLKKAEILPDTLKAYLDTRFGSDGRMTWFSYNVVADMVKTMGFTNMKEIDDCIKPYDGDHICRILRDIRQGQLRRFEYTLIAGMGFQYSRLHPWAGDKKFVNRCSSIIQKLSKGGIDVGSYEPKKRTRRPAR